MKFNKKIVIFEIYFILCIVTSTVLTEDTDNKNEGPTINPPHPPPPNPPTALNEPSSEVQTNTSDSLNPQSENKNQDQTLLDANSKLQKNNMEENKSSSPGNNDQSSRGTQNDPLPPSESDSKKKSDDVNNKHQSQDNQSGNNSSSPGSNDHSSQGTQSNPLPSTESNSRENQGNRNNDHKPNKTKKNQNSNHSHQSSDDNKGDEESQNTNHTDNTAGSQEDSSLNENYIQEKQKKKNNGTEEHREEEHSEEEHSEEEHSEEEEDNESRENEGEDESEDEIEEEDEAESGDTKNSDINSQRKIKPKKEDEDDDEDKEKKELLTLNEQEANDIKIFSKTKISVIEKIIYSSPLRCQVACYECIRHSLKDLYEDAEEILKHFEAVKQNTENNMDNETATMASDLKYSYNRVQKEYDGWVEKCKSNFPNGYCLYDSYRNRESIKNSVLVGGSTYWIEKCMTHYMTENIPVSYIEQVKKDFGLLVNDVNTMYNNEKDMGKQNCLNCIQIAINYKYNDVDTIINFLKKESNDTNEKEKIINKGKDLIRELYFSENKIETQWKYTCQQFQSKAETFQTPDKAIVPLLINKEDDSKLFDCMLKYVNTQHWLLMIETDNDDADLMFG